MRIEDVHTHSDLYPALQKFVGEHAVFFNQPVWLSNYPDANIAQCAILNNNNEVIGCFMYYRFKKKVVRFIITAPYSPNIDLFYLNPAESVVGKNSFNKDLFALIADYFESLSVPYININLPYSCVDTQPFTWRGYVSKIRYSYIINLHNSEDELWNNLSSEKRKSINKARKDGLEVQQTQDYALVHALIIKSLKRNDKDKNLSVLKQILFSFSTPSNSFAFVAYQNKKPIGATYCVINKDRAIYLFGGFDAENKHHGAGVSCMWQSILKSKELHLNYFDFEGSMNVAIERYFREFGGDLQPYFCVEKINPLLKGLLNLKGHRPV